jgi:hypothetical protein
MSFQPGKGSVESILFDTDTCAVTSNPAGSSNTVNTSATVTLKDQAGVTPGFYSPLSGYVNKKGIITAVGAGVAGSGAGTVSTSTLSIHQTQDVADDNMDLLFSTQILGDSLDTTFNNYSTLSGYNQGTGTFTAPRAGLYLATMSCIWSAAVAGGRRIYIQGDQSVSTSGLYASLIIFAGASAVAAAAPNNTPFMSCSGLIYLGIGDTIEFYANQDSGGALTSNEFFMGITFLGA